MLSREENELLCRVGPQTPMGRMMRRYWIPAMFRAASWSPAARRSESGCWARDLVAFRDAAGRLGVLDENCPHRGASLVLARAEACGLRCLYHGWKIDADGRVLETPPEPDELGFSTASARQLSGPRSGRFRVGVSRSRGYRAAAHDFAVALLPDTHRASQSVANRVQLGAVSRRRDRLRPLQLSARELDPPGAATTTGDLRGTLPRSSLQRRRAADRRPREHRLRIPLRRDPEADPRGRQAPVRPRDAVRRAVLRDLSGRPRLGQHAGHVADRRRGHQMFHYWRWNFDRPMTEQERLDTGQLLRLPDRDRGTVISEHRHVGEGSTPGQQLAAGSRGDARGQFALGDRRRESTGHRGRGIHGRDLR